MQYWVLKISDQELYADHFGVHYEFDNRHSIRVRAGDEFLYLDKRARQHKLIGCGVISRLTHRRPTAVERKRSVRIRSVFRAQFGQLVWFDPGVDISLSRKGRYNRSLIGITDFMKSGWNGSVISIKEAIFNHIIDVATGLGAMQLSAPDRNIYLPNDTFDDVPSYAMPDQWSMAKKRSRTRAFRDAVLAQHDYRCAVCGTTVMALLDVAHVRPWGEDPDNRLNPANALPLCAYCHRAYDSQLITLRADGTLLVSEDCLHDPVAVEHFCRVDRTIRRAWLSGVGAAFLMERAERYMLNHSQATLVAPR